MKMKLLIRAMIFSAIVALFMVWLKFPELQFRISLSRLNGSASGQEWGFSLNTFHDRITTDQIGQLYFVGSKKVVSMRKDAKSYVYEDRSGYMGCITLVQHSGSYEYVGVFGGNDSDLIKSGRSMGEFPSESYKILSEVPNHELPRGITRPW
jgi:hypothetical protein